MPLDVPHAELAALYAYWAERARAAGGLPARDAIDPLHLPGRMWRQLFLYERTAEGRLRCRLCGTAIVEIQGRDITGLHLDEAMRPDALVWRQAIMLRCLDECRPVYYEGPLAVAEREHRWTHRLTLPLHRAGDPPGVAGLLFGGVYYGPARRGVPWSPEPTTVVWADD